MFDIISGGHKLPRRLDPSRLTAIHGHLFSGHLYDAGQLRTTPLAKLQHVGFSARTHFTEPGKIQSELTSIFDGLRKANGLKGLSRLEFADAAADVFGRVNHVHSFLEGNGRTQQTFIRLLAQEAAHAISFAGVTRDRMYQASHDFSHGNPDAMRELFDELTCPVRARQLVNAHAFLQGIQTKMGLNLDDATLSACVPGRLYAGCKVITCGSDTCLIYRLPNIYIANRADIPGDRPESGTDVPPFVASRSRAQTAHHEIDMVERAAGRGKRAGAIAQLAAAHAHGDLASAMADASPQRIKTAKELDRGLTLQR
jgi:cell filamentation protein